MSSARQTVKTARNNRVQLTDAERATIDALNDGFVAGAQPPEGYDALAECRKSLAKETSEALRSAIPDLGERGRPEIERLRPELEKLKGTTWPTHSPAAFAAGGIVAAALPGSIGGLLNDQPHVVITPTTQPPHVGELWWAETSWDVTAPDNALNVDIDQDPSRIFGHIGYSSDELFTGTVGVVTTFILGPERMPRTNRTNFDLHPKLRLNGWVSGWTGPYHAIFAADDKWSKCWHYYEATLTLSSGEQLAGDSLRQNLFFLENASPVGQASISQVLGWEPVLFFTANMTDLRQHGVSIILRTGIRYDFQLEGDSDIWFRNRPGSASESVPTFDNALTFRSIPGVVPV